MFSLWSILFSIGTTFFFGTLTILFSHREEKIRKKLIIQNANEKKRLYEIAILKTIQDKIGYSLNIEEVIDTLTGSLKSIFPYSVAASLVIANEKLIFKAYGEESVNSAFIQQLKKNMLASLAKVNENSLPSEIKEIYFGAPIDEANMKAVASFFDIPLVINGKTLGILTVASTFPKSYKDEDIKVLYNIANTASTALSRLQTVIATENQKLLSMIGSLAEGIIMIDKNNNITLINEKAKKLLTLQTDTPTLVDIATAFSQKFDIQSKIQQVLTDQKTVEEKEFSLKDKILKIVMSPVFGPAKDNGKIDIIGVSVVVHDITLEKTLARMKEDFTSEVVHELRSPLSAIQSGSELMLHQQDHLDEDQRQKLLEIINKQSKRMLSDITSLLDAAKLDSGHFSIYQKPEDIESLLKESVALFQSEAQKKNIQLTVDIESHLSKALFDQMRMNQVINNLISNSLKYTPEGGKIFITAKKYYNEHLPQTPTNPGILVSIADNGIGIPLDKQANLFSKFARLENIGYVHSTEGTGLGLYITKGIIEAHGGKIFLQSTTNQGTTVSFTLPLAKDIVQNVPLQNATNQSLVN